MRPTETIERFDVYLESLGLRLEAVVIGGTALNLLGIVTRVTKDCDVLVPELSDAMRAAAKSFATFRRDGKNVRW